MSDLSNQTPADTYKGLLQVNDYTNGVDATAKYIQDGEGTDSVLALSTDNVGIGTTIPRRPLEIQIADDTAYAGSGAGNALIIANTSQASDSFSSIEMFAGLTTTGGANIARIFAVKESTTTPATSLAFITRDSIGAVSERMRIDSNGNVGIGVTNPGSKLHLSSDENRGVYASTYARTETPDLFVQNIQTDSSTGSTKILLRNAGTSGMAEAAISVVNKQNADGALAFSLRNPDDNTNIVERMRIDADGNVGIGTTSPSEKLHVSGNAIITGDLSVSGTTTTVNTQTLSVEDHQIILGTLSTGTPTDLTADGGGVVLKGDTDKTILWSNSEDAWICNQNFIADGNVGIGTTSPDEKLHIEDGFLQLSRTIQTNNIIRFQEVGTTSFNIGTDVRDNGFFIAGSSFTNDRFFTVKSDGNVGIGTASPSAPLHIVGTPSSTLILERDSADASAISSVIFKDGSDDQVRISSTDSKFLFETGAASTPRMVIEADGNVGIGTASPQSELHIESNVANHDTTLKIENRQGDTGGTAIEFQGYRDVDNDHWVAKIVADHINSTVHGSLALGSKLGFYTWDGSADSTAAPKMTIDQNGNVGIGTTSPSEKLHVSGNAIITGDLSVSGTTTTVNTQTLSVEDHQIILGTLSTGTPTDLTADGGGVVLKGDTDKTILWSNSEDAWICNQNFIADGNVGIGVSNPGSKLHLSSDENRGVYASTYARTETPDLFVQNIQTDSSTGSTKILLRNAGTSGMAEAAISVVNKQNADGALAFSLRNPDDNTNIVERMRIDADGNVGIGTTNPDALLDVEGSLDQLNCARLKNTSGTGYGLMAQGGGNGSTRYIADFRDKDGTSRLKIDGDGNVGIGTESPGYKLEVNEATNSTYAAKIFNNGGDSYGLLVKTSSGTSENFPILDLENTSSNVFRVQADGKVGIGTTSPIRTLDVRGEANYVLNNSELLISNTADQCRIHSRVYSTNAAKDLGIYIGTTERMRIDSDGNVGIGTTSPSAPLHIVDTGTTDMIFLESTDGGDLNSPDFNLYRNSASPAADDKIGVLKFSGNSSAGSATGYAHIEGTIVNPTNLKSKLAFKIRSDGALESRMEVGPDKVEVNSELYVEGNVGIGTTSPDEELHIEGSSAPYIKVEASDDTDAGVALAKQGVNKWFILNDADASDNFAIRGDGGGIDEFLTITQDGNVGIGTESPTAKLDVSSSGSTTINITSGSTGSSQLFFGDPEDTNAGYILYDHQSNFMSFRTNGVGEDVRITQDGNVGIGTSSPDEELHIEGGGGLVAAKIKNTTSSDSSLKLENTVGQLVIANQTGYLNFIDATSGTPEKRMTIDPDGNVGIGTTNPNQLLHVNSTSASSSRIRIENSEGHVEVGTDGTDGFLVAGATEVLRFDSDGNVGIGTTSPSAPLHIFTSNAWGTTDALLLESADDSNLNAPDIALYRNSASPAADDKIGVLKFRGTHSGGGSKNYANIQGIIVDPTNLDEDSKITFEVRTGGALESRMEVGPDKVEVNSTTGGVIMPRMNTAQRTAISASDGEMVYDTDSNKFYGYANGAWVALH